MRATYAKALYEDDGATLDDLREAVDTYEDTERTARRVLGENNQITLAMRWNYAGALYKDDGATLDDLREAIMTLEDAGRIARRVFGGTHPFVGKMESSLRESREVLSVRDVEPLRDAVGAMGV